MTFLPDKYSIPKSPSKYMKLEDGENKFRVLSSAIVGYEYFNAENKPVRSREMFDEYPLDIKKDSQGNDQKIKPFWAFVVWDFGTKQVKILEITQKQIMTVMQNTVNNPAWGDPKRYNFSVTRAGQGFDTEYSTVPEPPSLVPEITSKQLEIVESINLEALYTGEDPFTTPKKPQQEQFIDDLQAIADKIDL